MAVVHETTSNVRHIGGKAPAGGPVQIGDTSSSLVGFFGATPVAQVAVTAVGTTTATTTLNETRLGRLEAALVTLGLINTGG